MKTVLCFCNYLLQAIGAPRPTWRELDDEIMQNSFIVADSIDAAIKEAGDVVLSKVRVCIVLIINHAL